MKIKPYEDRVDGVDKPNKPTDTTSHGLAEQQRIDIQRQDAMINDLIQLTRLQNTELNNLRQEVRRISASAAAKEDGLRKEMEGLKLQVSGLRAEQQDEKSGGETPTKLTRKAHVAIRDPQTVKDRIIAAVKEDVTAKTLELEEKQYTLIVAQKGQIYELEKIMSSVLSGIGCLYKTIVPPSETRDEVSSIKHFYDDLEQNKADLIDKIHRDSGLSSISKQQILLHHQFSELSKALEQRLSAAAKSQDRDFEKEEKPAHMQKQVDKLSKTIHSHLQVMGDHDMSITWHSEELEKIQRCLQIVVKVSEKTKQDSEGLKHRILELEQKLASKSSAPFHATTWNSVGDSSMNAPEAMATFNTTVEKLLQEILQRLSVVENIGSKHENSLFSNCKNLVILQKRLSYAEKLIGGSSKYSFTIRGKSFYEDATSLRYITKCAFARDTFSKFYGSRAEAARFVEIAPPVVMMALNAIARVRCRPEMWEDKLQLKQELGCVAERIVDSWQKTLPLGERKEHVPWHDRGLTEDENQLELLYQRANMAIGLDPLSHLG